MSTTYRQPELVSPDVHPMKLTPRNQLLAETMLRTTRLYVRRRIRQSLQQASKKSTLCSLEQKKSCAAGSDFVHVQSACDQVFAIQELADAILAHLGDFHDVSCCLAVNRTFRHAVQQSIACKLTALPFKACEDPHLFHMEKQLDLVRSASYWWSHAQRFSMNSGNISYPRNAPWPMLVSVYDVYNSIGEHRKSRVTVDMGFSSDGHTPGDFRLHGSWLELSLPLPDTVVWVISIACDCHRTNSFLDRLETSDQVDRNIYNKGTPLVFPYKIITQRGDHLKQIAIYARRAYRMHRHCRNDAGDRPAGLSSITFKALEEKESRSDILALDLFSSSHAYPASYSTSPSPKFRSTPSSSWASWSPAVPREKTRGEVLEEIILELADFSSNATWDEASEDVSSDDDENILPRSQSIPSEELAYTLRKLSRLSAWDKLMGRTEMRLGY